MKYKKLIIIAVLLFSIGWMTEVQSQNMYVMGRDGLQTVYALNNIKKLNFSSGNIIVSEADGNFATYALTDIRYLNFQDFTTSVFFAENKGSDPVDLKVFPNPVSDVLNIKFTTSGSPKEILEIFTLDGRLVLMNELQPDKNIHQINVSGLNQGIYLCRIKNMQMINTIKFIKN